MTGTEWPVIRQRETRLEKKKSRHADITRGRFVCDPASGDGWQDVGSKRTDYCDCIFMHPVVGNGSHTWTPCIVAVFFSVDASNARTDCANILRLRIECILACI